MSGRMENRVAIVTGGGSGIGGETAIRFAQEGAAVLIADLDPDRSANIIKKIRSKHHLYTNSIFLIII